MRFTFYCNTSDFGCFFIIGIIFHFSRMCRSNKDRMRQSVGGSFPPTIRIESSVLAAVHAAHREAEEPQVVRVLRRILRAGAFTLFTLHLILF